MSEKVVVQKYIENPCLLDNKKWGFRTVVLCEGTRVWTPDSLAHPKTMYMWDNLYIYVSSSDYTTDNIDDRNIHVTNRRVQVKAGN